MLGKVSSITSILLLFVFLFIAGVFIYMFALEGSTDKYTISTKTKILGISNTKSYDSNFIEPDDVTYIQEDLLSTKIENEVTSSANPKDVYNISIPKIGVENSMESTNDINVLKDQGWLLLPWTYQYQDSWLRFPPWKERMPKTEAIVVCYRKFYGPTNPKSCYDLNKLSVGDEIQFDENIYSIKSLSLVRKDLESIFNASNEGEYLKLITNSGPNYETDQNSNYLVVIAQKLPETAKSE